MAEIEEEKGTEVEEPTLTLEEQMEAIKTQLAEANERATAAEARAEEKEEGFKTLQRRLSKQKPIPQVSTSGTTQALHEMIGALEAQARETGELSPATQAKLNAARQQMAMAEQQAAYERQDVITNGVIADLRDELEEAGIDPDSPQCDGIWDSIKIAKASDGDRGASGYFETAKNRASRIIKSAEPKKEKVEPELDEDDPRVQAAALKLFKKNPAFKTHEGTPSGASGSDDEFLKRFNTGELNSPEDKKRAKKILSNL